MMGYDKPARAYDFFKTMPYANVVWVLGNHDPKPDRLAQIAKDFNVNVVPMGVPAWHYGFLLSHLPYDGVYVDERHEGQGLVFPKDDGWAMLHGHVHSTDTVKRSPAGSMMIHVGIDAHGGLISQDQIIHIAYQHRNY